ncbi:MAG: methylmalonyl Co-A mutase-associated GTPase MeaB [Deltaproteobacteria bacterium]|nr:methylmalonyl Co-A mutase-associated GTPase MeaB [Deltaproteobacteria bacterium]
MESLRGKRDQRALSRLFSIVENDESAAAEVMRLVGAENVHSYVIGITGPPGSGKSTLVDRLIRRFRTQGSRVGVIAIDPTSPFSGGALLGDRVRMQAHAGDEGVFIRSVGTRGVFGGLSRVTRRGIHLMEVFGLDVIFVETVGVGQTELDVMNVVDTVALLLVPESGDAIQTLKAGLMEIADIFVVNKSDRAGADVVARQLRELVALGGPAAEDDWKIVVEQAQSENDIGVDQVYSRLIEHRAFLSQRGLQDQRRVNQRKKELLEIIETRFEKGVLSYLAREESMQILTRVEEGELDPYQAADFIWGKLIKVLKEEHGT